MMYRKYSKGLIEVITGPMFSGKSEELIRRIKILAYGNVKTLVLKPEIDNRWSEQKITSRAGVEIDTFLIKNSDQIMKLWDPTYQALVIDEAQFLDQNLIKVVTKLANEGSHVIISMLDLDFSGQPFGFAPQLLALAEKVDKLAGVCMVCGNAATMTYRKGESQNIIEVGDQTYETRCRTCHNLGQKNKQLN